MLVEMNGKSIHTEGEVHVVYTDGTKIIFVPDQIERLYINKDNIRTVHILKKDK